ncbi:TetR family transcriptional regulator [Planosporangium thailandense]|uniref:TetR family transcriptional regulator n=1 Tax=Planosporangium thailandense TaxID=765197 RepID=A0ABX0Y2P2_9ACTN|nr:TetR family transcriptional regulator [Planosporangium thailandense]NJC72630.1 TetR family transcriptional regulator [Planosporangium thailandense]
MDMGGKPVVRRARRFDPKRRERILDAAIEVIAEHGVAGTTHRLIARAADVPLGSLTYHFTGLDELRALAFTRLAERLSRAYAAHFDGVRTLDDLVEAVTDMVHGNVGTDAREWAVSYELYLAALRDPALRTVTEEWMRTSRTVLERFVDPDTARGLDALIEGLVMHRMLSTAPFPRAVTRAAVARAVQPLPGTDAGRTPTHEPEGRP